MKKRVLKMIIGILGFAMVFGAVFGTLSIEVSAETEYEYDDLNRLTKERHDDGTVIYYSYDSNGNLLEVKIGGESGTGNERADEGQAGSRNETPNGNRTGETDSGLGGEVLEKGGSNITEKGLENAVENNGEDNGGSQTGYLQENVREGIGEIASESISGGEKAGEGDVFENKDGNGTVIAKLLAVLAALTAASFGGVFAWKKRKSDENKR